MAKKRNTVNGKGRKSYKADKADRAGKAGNASEASLTARASAAEADEEIVAACNRLPFKSDEECDRGDVDITAFDSFPICSPWDPTPPDSATPKSDFPVIPFTPPPCTCVDIAVDGSVGISKQGRLSGNFSAVGDCCEGNYDLDVDIVVPCVPFNLGPGTRKPINVESKCTKWHEDPSGTVYARLKPSDGDECGVDVETDIDITIPIPKVRTYQFDIEMDCYDPGDESSGGSGTPTVEKETTVDEQECEISEATTFKLKIPKVKRQEFDFKIGYIGCEEDPRIDQNTSVLVDTECLEVNKTDVEIGIPQPKVSELVIEMDMECYDPGGAGSGSGDSGSDESKPKVVVTTETVGDECHKTTIKKFKLFIPMVKLLDVDFNVEEIDCGQDAKVTVSQSVEREECLEIKRKAITLQIPKAPEITGSDGEVKIEGSWDGVKGTLTGFDFDDKCDVKINPVLELDIPCGMADGKGTLSASVDWGDGTGQRVDLFETSHDKCSITPLSPSLDLTIPCPELNIVGGSGIEVTFMPSGPCGKSGSAGTYIISATGGGGGSGSDSSDSSISYSSSSSSSHSGAQSSSESGSKSGSESGGESGSSGSSGKSGGSGSSGGSGGSGSSGGSGGSGSSGKSGGSDSDSGGSGGGEGSFVCVTDVQCSASGGLIVQKKRITIDFANKTVKEEPYTPDGGEEAAEAEQHLARDLLISTIQAIRNDPDIVSIVDDPTSERARRSLAKMGIGGKATSIASMEAAKIDGGADGVIDIDDL